MKKAASMVAVISMLGFLSSFSFSVEEFSKDGYMVNEDCGCNKKKKKPSTLPPPPVKTPSFQ
ncbi:MAG: hypothetical protein V4489_09260 [Chlamydiota bacterium]